MIKKLAIVIPAHNEERRIQPTLRRYGLFFSELKKQKILDYEILVVINNTKDKTEQIVIEEQKKNPNLKLLNFKQGGKGFAITEGFKKALKNPDNDFIGFVDADMSTSPEAFYDLCKSIKNCDGIIASRYIKGSIVKPKQSFARISASRVFNFLIRSFFFMNYRDTQCGAKIFTRTAVQKIVPFVGMTQWAFDIDLLYNARRLGMRIREHPTIWADKEASKLNIKKTSIQMFLAIIQLRIWRSPARRMWKFIAPIAGVLWRMMK